MCAADFGKITPGGRCPRSAEVIAVHLDSGAYLGREVVVRVQAISSHFVPGKTRVQIEGDENITV